MEYITYEEFKKLDIRVGTIKEIEPVPDTDKLLRCQIDFNEKDEEGNKKLRQIISGIREYYPEYEKLIGKQVLYIVNLEPRMIKGYESQGMLMAVDGLSTQAGVDGNPVFLVPEVEVNAGSKVR
ncbi:MAG: methionine--tRNA ligase [Patescibacteria group bacterium]|nr:methionine--tRNA ligase [Patescibacteria group bacterium]